MRLRKIKDAALIIEKSSYYVKDFLAYNGQFKVLFSNNNPIHLEIGMGKGDFIVEMALKYPNINFIGLEKYDSVLMKAILKVVDKKLDNLKFINADANMIEKIFNKEISTLYLNFSDPWPKNKHSKRRLTSDIFLKKYETIFKNNYHIILKTDNRLLFEFSLQSLVNNNYKIIDISLDLHQDNYPSNIMTEYEKKFVDLGFNIYMVEVKNEKY